jgi:hypothetical protein
MIGALAACLTLTALSAGSPRVDENTTFFKGPMDPSGKIRFQFIEAKRDGAPPKLDRFRFTFDCNDGRGPARQNYGVLSGDSLRPNEFGKFRIRAAYPGTLLLARGDFNRRFTKATGLMRFKGDVGDGEHTDCDTGPLEWEATPLP